MFNLRRKSTEPQEKTSVPLATRLALTRDRITGQIQQLLAGRGQIDEEFLEEVETMLVSADVGAQTTMEIIDGLRERVAKKEIEDPLLLLRALKIQLLEVLMPCQAPLDPRIERKPFVLLTVGVNGVGKTTTIGKMAQRFGDRDLKVLLAAGDTFRAAAVDQLRRWGERLDVPVVAQAHGADPAAVIFDALEAARARDIDVVIADTAGRLHTQANLMAELEKIGRVVKKFDTEAPHETMLVVDGTTGQNAVAQTKQFGEAVPLSGLTVTKLDGTAKGGVVFALAKQFGLPIRYIGVGEQASDLRPFSAIEFVDALLPDEALVG